MAPAPWERWAIIAGGPSTAKVRNVDLDRRSVVAVNLGIKADCRVDYWCFIDDPYTSPLFDIEGVAGAYNARGISRPIVWTCLQHVGPTLRKARECGLECMAVDGFPARHEILRHYIPWKTRFNWGSRSIFMAIAGAISRGARDIRVWGADMQGAGGFGRGWTPEESAADRKRWWRERLLWRMAHLEATRNGITIDRMGLEGEV